MLKYIGKRLLQIIPVFLLITLLVFSMLSVVPGNVAQSIAGANASVEQIKAIEEQLGLDRPFFVRYLSYMKDAIRGDFGISWTTAKSVSREFFARLPYSLLLTFLAVGFTVIIGVPLGVISAAKQYQIIDKVTLVTSMIFACVPAFWLALLAQVLFSVQLGWLPSGGTDSWKSYIMPSFCLGASSLGALVRLTRASMLDVLGQDYIRTAMAKGGTKTHVIVRHALRNALLPVITAIGSTITVLLSGAIIIETVFSIGGIGSMLIGAVRARDVPMVMGPVIFLSLFICVVNLIVNVIYTFVDPRVRQRFAGR